MASLKVRTPIAVRHGRAEIVAALGALTQFVSTTHFNGQSTFAAPVLAHLLALNKVVAANEKAKKPVTGPGLPSVATATYVTTDRLVMPSL